MKEIIELEQRKQDLLKQLKDAFYRKDFAGQARITVELKKISDRLNDLQFMEDEAKKYRQNKDLMMWLAKEMGLIDVLTIITEEHLQNFLNFYKDKGCEPQAYLAKVINDFRLANDALHKAIEHFLKANEINIHARNGVYDELSSLINDKVFSDREKVYLNKYNY
ncbi:MAG: hypothetical protein RSH25_16580 [Bacteroides sp.]|uniref:hypothetical protein n=1 Tax=Bacteroides sp. TaxID=29523 RepID=UPI002FC75ED8